VAASAYGGDEPDEVMEAKALAPFAVPLPPYARKAGIQPEFHDYVKIVGNLPRQPRSTGITAVVGGGHDG
jgi:hypothetical protein